MHCKAIPLCFLLPQNCNVGWSFTWYVTGKGMISWEQLSAWFLGSLVLSMYKIFPRCWWMSHFCNRYLKVLNILYGNENYLDQKHFWNWDWQWTEKILAKSISRIKSLARSQRSKDNPETTQNIWWNCLDFSYIFKLSRK